MGSDHQNRRMAWTDGGPSRATAVATAAAFALALGLAEWLARRPVSPFDAATSSLLAVIAVHLTLGIGAGVVAMFWSPLRRDVASVLAAVIAALLPAAAFALSGGRAAIAVAALAAIPVFAGVRRVVGLLAPTPHAIGRLLGGVLALAVLAVCFRSADGQGPVFAAVLAGGALLACFRGPAWGPVGLAAFAVASLVALGLPAASRPPAPDGAPSVLLITLDTLRADRLGFHGHEAARTPTLDALAAEGRWFRNAQSLSSWTGPSHLSILTGRTPERIGVVLNGRPLPDGVPHLGTVLGAAGWHTAGFVSGFPLQARTLGVRGDFHVYDDAFEARGLQAFGSTITQGLHERRTRAVPRRWRRSAAEVNAQALPWLAAEAEAPFFLWAHYYDAHLPYEQRETEGPTDGRWYSLTDSERAEIAASRDLLAHMDALYDEQIAYLDRKVAELVERARDTAGDDLWIIVTADHGESFGEHGLYFDRDAYEVTGRVPLILVAPPGDPHPLGPVDAIVGIHDIAPTLLGALGVELPEEIDGVDLYAKGPPRAIQKLHEPEEPGSYGRSRSVRQDRFRYLEREAGWKGREYFHSATEFYDVEADPLETRNLAGTAHPAEAVLRELAAGAPEAEVPVTDPAELDAETREALRALGYLD